MSTSDPGTPEEQSGSVPPTPPPGPSPYGQSPYGQPAPPPYGQPQHPQQPSYGQQPPYGDPQQPGQYPGQYPGQGYGQGYGYPTPPPNHPSATTSLVLGLIGLVGVVACGGVTLVLSPFAWAIGAKSVREIDESPGVYGGRDQANAGKIMGIIGTVLLILGVIALAVLVVGLVAASGSSTTTS